MPAAAATARTMLAAATIVALATLAAVGPAGGASSAKRDRVRPSAPSNVRVTSASPLAIRIEWDAARDNIAVAGYDVHTATQRLRVKGTAYDLEGLGCGQTSTVGVRAVDRAGNRSSRAFAVVSSPACGDLRAPSTPSGFVQRVTTPDAVVLSWTPSADDVGVVNYRVYRSLLPVVTTAEPIATLVGLQCGSNVPFRVDAVDASGNRSAQGSVVVTTAPCVDPRPTAPRDLTVEERTSSSLSLAWTPSSDDVGVAGYRISIAGSLRSTTAQARGIADGLRCGVRYRVGIEAFDANGTLSRQTSLAAETLRCATPGRDSVPPSTPTGLTAAKSRKTQIMLDWNASIDNVAVAAYDLYRNDRRVATGTATSAQHGALRCGTAYEFGVAALDAAGNVSERAELTASTAPCSDPTAPAPSPSPPAPAPSPPAPAPPAPKPSPPAPAPSPPAPAPPAPKPSPPAPAPSPPAPAPPAPKPSPPAPAPSPPAPAPAPSPPAPAPPAPTPSPSPPAPAPSPPAAPPPVDASAPSMPANLVVTASTRTNVTLAWAASTDNRGVAGYRTYVNGSAEATTTETRATISSLSCGTTYTFQVDAYDAAGNRSPRASMLSPTAPCADTQAPTAPTNVLATSRTTTSIALAWAASSDNVGVTGYGLYRGGTRVGTSNATTTIFAGLVCNTNYTLAVDAQDAVGNRSAKTTLLVSTTACPDTTPPTAPAGLAASSITQSGLRLGWSASSDNVGVTGYDVHRNGTKTATVATTSSSQLGLACGTAYSFGVVARDAAGNSSPQASLQVSTAACPPPPPAPAPPPPAPAPPPPSGASWVGDFRGGGQDFSAFDMHDARFTTFTDPAVGQTKDVTIVPKPSGSVYPSSNHMARVIANNSLPSNSQSGQTVNLWQPGGYGQPWVRGNTVWSRVVLVIPDGTDPRYPGKLTPTPGDGVSSSWHVLAEWHKNDGAGAPGPTSAKLEIGWGGGGGPALMFKPIGGLSGDVRGWYFYETDQVQGPGNGAGGSTGPVGGNVVPLKFNHEYDLLFKWVLDPNPAVGHVEWYVNGKLRVSGNFPTMFQKPDGSVPGLSFQAGLYRNFPSWAGNVTQTTSGNEHVYVVAMLTGPTRSSVGG